MRVAAVPHIDSYVFGMINIDGQQHTSDLKIFPDKVHTGWWRQEGHLLHIEDIQDVISESPDAIIIGTGASGALSVPAGVKEELESLGIDLIALPTRQAVETHNTMARSKRVVTCLHLTC
jgi:hypothetical protein